MELWSKVFVLSNDPKSHVLQVVMAVSRTFWSIENRSLQLWTWVVFN
jgi:hypothetical protein